MAKASLEVESPKTESLIRKKIEVERAKAEKEEVERVKIEELKVVELGPKVVRLKQKIQ